MAKGGHSPKDYRSEAERIGSRPDLLRFNEEYHRGERAPRRVEVRRAARFEEAKSVDAAQKRIWSDQLIGRKVLDALRAEISADLSDIELDIEDGVVLLEGSVDTINTKYRMAEIVKRFAGVREVNNRLKIRVGDALDEFTRGIDTVRAQAQINPMQRPKQISEGSE
jgi:hypothetical protein